MTTTAEKLAATLLAAPDPQVAVAYQLGDHEQRLDALAREVARLRQRLEAKHGGAR